MFLLYILIATTHQVYPGEAACNTYLFEADCISSKYCLWSGSQDGCQNQICYLIDEVAACRTGGALFGFCFSSSYTPSQYAESCQQTFLTGQRIYYYRYVSDLSGDKIQQTSLVLSNLMFQQPNLNNLDKIYTLDVILRSYSELQSILDLYLSCGILLRSEQSHPYYIERIIYETLQHTRDNYRQTILQRQQTLKKVRKLIDILYDRLSTFSEVHQTQYSFINFNLIHLKYLELDSNIVKVTWDEYESNGFIRMSVIYAEIFGMISTVSPILIITTSDGQNLKYKLTWQLTTANYIALMQINLITLQLYDSSIQPICSNGYCEALLSGQGNYVFTDVTKTEGCTQITSRGVCYIALCKWNYSNSFCENP